MGLCFTKNEERVYYKYQYIPIQELLLELKDNDTCYLCKKKIYSQYTPTTKCCRCHKMIGPAMCVSLWMYEFECCPICKR